MTKYIAILLLLSTNLYSQAPEKFKYQATLRNSSGEIIINQNVSVRISIVSEIPNGTEEYCEIHLITTNEFGLINLTVGEPTAIVFGEIGLIDWGGNSYFLRVEVDINAGTNFVEMGTTQILSVPYSLYSAKSDSALYAKNAQLQSYKSPLGFQNIEPITFRVLDDDTFTVPPNKNLFITHILLYNEFSSMIIDNILYINNEKNANYPIILSSGQIILAQGGAISFNGYYIQTE